MFRQRKSIKTDAKTPDVPNSKLGSESSEPNGAKTGAAFSNRGGTKTDAKSGAGGKEKDTNGKKERNRPASRRRKAVLLILALAIVLAIGAGVFLVTRNQADTASGASGASDASDASDAVDEAGDADSGGSTSSSSTRARPFAPPDPSAVLTPLEGQFDGTGFLATFDGEPSQPQGFNPDNWDVTVHSRDPQTWDSLHPVDADHGPGCSAPPDTHLVTAYEDAAYLCKNHLMTAINGDGYGLVYLTPPYQVDFSDGTAVISVEMSTLRTSARDWWDIWISPYDDALQLPLDLDAEADLAGPPRNAIRVGLGSENQMMAEIYEGFENVQFPDWPEGSVSGDTWTGYETFLEPDLRRRDTFEIHISRTSLKVGMPDYDFWWIDTEIPELAWGAGVVQFGHHSYNPIKDCNVANNPLPPVDECSPNTWHWDNFSISPAAPFSIVRAEQRTAHPASPIMTFVAPAPAGAKLRFAGIGIDMMVRFDDGPWQSATVQATKVDTDEEKFASYWVDVPAGTTQVQFSAEQWYGGSWHVRDASFWSLDS